MRFATVLSAVGVVVAVSCAYAAADPLDDPQASREAWMHKFQQDSPSTSLLEDATAKVRPPYTLTAEDVKKFRGTFGLDLSHYKFDLNNMPADCVNRDNYPSPRCSCIFDWTYLSEAGITFTYSKASDGGDVDRSFRKYWSELADLHAKGTLYRGGYHFLRPKIGAEIQAKAYLDQISIGDEGYRSQLPPILDIEWSNKRVAKDSPEYRRCPPTRLLTETRSDGSVIYRCDMWHEMSSEAIIGLASKWIDIVERATKRKVIIYTNVKAWWDPIISTSGKDIVSKHDFWLSRYTESGPAYDSSWTREGGSMKWRMPPMPQKKAFPAQAYNISTFWQFTEKGYFPKVPRICAGKPSETNIDLNWMPLGRSEFIERMVKH